jgi:hypothetical protein
MGKARPTSFPPGKGIGIADARTAIFLLSLLKLLLFYIAFAYEVTPPCYAWKQTAFPFGIGASKKQVKKQIPVLAKSPASEAGLRSRPSFS